MRFLALLFILALSSSHVFGLTCNQAHPAPQTPYEILNAQLTEKYPSLAIITKDPRQFVSLIQERFRQQKLKDPSRALEFDYTEVARPAVKYTVENLVRKMTSLEFEVQGYRQQLQQTHSLRILKRRALHRRIKEGEIGLQFFELLLKEGQGHLAKGEINYRTMIEYLYYFSRAIGHFDNQKLSISVRFYLEIDRRLQGYKQLPIEAELARYQNRKFEIFQRRSSNRNFRDAEKTYLYALQHPDAVISSDRLGAIIFPIFDHIDRDILMRLMPREISIVGLTADPIAADGFLRPGGDFWIHDLRHESARIHKMMEYMEKHGINEVQWEKMAQLQEKMTLEVNTERDKVTDPNLREAIDLISGSMTFSNSVWRKSARPGKTLPKTERTNQKLCFFYTASGAKRSFNRSERSI